ncbi:MAG: hypothetical protein KKF65_06620 [Nanoarchaeota archaeon]|nr:hypothetical protein [Nanoarchaeota archaeon]
MRLTKMKGGRKMYNDKKGVSAVLVTIILVALALVLITVFWSSITNLFGAQVENIDYTQKCLGANLDIKSLTCATGTCTIEIERSIGNKEEISGVGLTIYNATDSGTEELKADNFDLSDTLTATDIGGADEVRARSYFTDEGGENHFCEVDIFKNA